MLGLQKRGQAASADQASLRANNQTSNKSSPNGDHITTNQTPIRQSIKIDIHSTQAYSPSPHRIKHKRQNSTLPIMLILTCTFLTMLNLMHQKINQFQLEAKQQTLFRRQTLMSLLFDPKALPQYSNLHGRYTGCIFLNGMLAPHNYNDAVFVDKELDIVNGSGTNLVNRYRLKDYDYEEVKGIVASFNNAFIYGSEPIVYDCHVKFRPGGANALDLNGFGRALEGITMKGVGGGGVNNYQVPLGIPPPPSVGVINGTAVLIAQYWGQRYYHWMSECFPRLALVKDYLDAHPSAKILFFRGDDTKQTILKMIGIDPDRIIEYTSMLTFVEHLIVPTATAEGRIIQRAGGIMNKHLRNAIREMFHIPYNPTWRSSPSVAKAPSIIIQQRSPGGARSMTNGDDLVSAVKKAYPNAVVEVFHHDETIWDAMRMHYGADLVIGPHGAGESNALFMRPGAVMLEIYMKVGMMGPLNWLNPCHNHTSNSVGVKHYYVISKSGDHGTPMEVDIDVVMEKLLEIFPYYSTYVSKNESLSLLNAHRLQEDEKTKDAGNTNEIPYSTPELKAKDVGNVKEIPDSSTAKLEKINPYTSDAMKKNPYLGWQPTFPSPDSSFSWRTCFSIRPTAPVSKLPQECREHPDIFGKAPKVDKNWVPDVTMVRTMLMYGKDQGGHAFPPPLDKELCEDFGVMGDKEEDTNKKCLKETNIKPTGPLNATTVTFDPSNHFGVDGTSGLVTVNAPTLMCMVYTLADAHSSRIQGMRETWAGGCDGFLAFSTESDPRLPAMAIQHDGPEEYDNMWQKSRSIWKFVGKHYIDDFDWFFLGGDDLFVMPHNLKTYLASLMYKDKADPKVDEYYVGRRFSEWGETPFNSGGAGYTLSRATLRKFLTVIDDEEHCSAKKHTSGEDVEIGRCLINYLGINFTDTRDSLGRERFIPFAPGTILTREINEKDWYYMFNTEWGLKSGKDCCAPDSVSFHYLKKAAMVRHVQALLYFCNDD
ncbi:hypothetical protein ACHAWO_005438 [Cyclotella atomus]|uniref:N-acetylgalactosaminide beta-1,3-galactosyltransferase n=1 Tax=Cyclotella atomus TaxID=382360 RepID=A0ABD3Q2N3_9STRA